MTHTLTNAIGTFKIDHDPEVLNQFMSRLKSFYQENAEYISSLDLDGYLSDAVEDGEYVLRQFMPEAPIKEVIDADMRAWHHGRAL